MESRSYGFEGSQEGIERLHKERRIFAIIKDRIEIAPEGVPYSHKEWLESLDLSGEEINDIMNNGLRGYVSPTGDIFIYRGYNFDFDESLGTQTGSVISELQKQLDLNKDASVFGGVQVGEAGKPWPPKTTLGKVGELENK